MSWWCYDNTVFCQHKQLQSNLSTLNHSKYSVRGWSRESKEILTGVSGVMNIKVKHPDDQLYNFLISQPGGSLVSSATRQMNETYWSEGPRLD